MHRHFLKPTNYKDPLHLFEIVMNNLIVKKKEKEYLHHSTMANIVFKNGDAIHQSYLSIVTNQFSDYMIRYKNKYKFYLEMVHDHFPHFYQKTTKNHSKLFEISKAIQHEKEASFRKRIGRIIYVSKLEEIEENETYFFYNLFLELDNDTSLKIYEGTVMTLALDKKRHRITALDFDEIESKLTFRIKIILNSKFKKAKRTRIVIEAGWLLDELSECLDNYPTNNLPISKLLSSDWEPSSISNTGQFYRGVLDNSQMKAIEKCLTQDITAIWGPPGTGKSTTLGYLLLELFKRKEKTLVCSIANVAVDSILKLCLKTFLKYEQHEAPLNYRNGKILRVGYSRDPDIYENPDIKIQSSSVNRINYQLQKIKDDLKDDELEESERAELISERLDLLKDLESEKRSIINGACLIFAAASKIEIDETLRFLEVDNIIIDEASMMSAPHLLAIAKNTKKRIIIAGDFRQLGPIAIAQSAFAYKWLHTDLFQFMGIDYTNDDLNHPTLAMLMNQRRFHKSICDLINAPFYQNQLNTETQLNSLKLFNQKPIKEKTILYYNLSGLEEFKTLRTKEHSRYNPGSMNYIIQNIIKPLRCVFRSN